MGKVLVDFQDIENYKKGNKCGRPGIEGACYFLDKETLVKIYHVFYKNRITHFSDIIDSDIAFPIDILLYEDTNLEAGYTMKYLQGEKFLYGFSDKILISDLKKAYLDLKKKIELYRDIYMQDMSLVNIMYSKTENKFKLIDTDQWYTCYNSNIENLKQLDLCLSYAIFKYNASWVSLSDDKSDQLFDLYKWHKLGYTTPFLEVLEVLEKELNEKYGVKAKNIADLTPKIYKI